MEDEKCLSFKNPNHLADLNNMRLSGQLCDVTIKVNGREFRAHKNILAANLKYFKSMFLSDFQESRQDVVTLDGVDDKTFELFLFFAYTGEILLTGANVLDLLEVANYLNEGYIEQTCKEFLEKHMKKEDACRAYKLATAMESLLLKNVAKTNILKNFEWCSQTADYLTFDYENLKDILLDVKLYFGVSQETCFGGVMNWIVHNIESRSVYIDSLLDSIDITKLDKDYLLKYFCKNVENQYYGDVVKYVMSTYYNKRKGIEHQTERLMIVGQSGNSFCTQFFDFTEKKWNKPHKISHSGAYLGQGLILNDKFYHLYKSGNNALCIQVVDLTRGHKTILTSENVLRYSALCAFDRFLYLCGGMKIDGTRSNQVLRHESLTNSYETLALMKTERSSATAICYQGCLHVTGGYISSGTLDSVEKYDAKEWTTLPSMCQARYQHALAILDGRLYACGGFYTLLDREKIPKVEVYDSFTNSWQLVTSMKKARAAFLVVARKGKLLAIGGDNEKTVEVYDPHKDEWQLDQELSFGLKMQIVVGGSISSFMQQ